MVVVSTHVGNLRESARTERFEPEGSVTATNVQGAVTQLDQLARGAQRSITSSGNLPITVTDQILNINAASDLTPTIPAAAARAGLKLTLKNLPGSHVQTLQRTASDTFDGQTTFVLQPGASVSLNPFNDTVNSGYFIT